MTDGAEPRAESVQNGKYVSLFWEGDQVDDEQTPRVVEWARFHYPPGEEVWLELQFDGAMRPARSSVLAFRIRTEDLRAIADAPPANATSAD